MTRRFFIVSASLLAVATILLLFSVHYLPMVDLPQHAAQVALWLHHDDPRFGPAELYEFNWFTPYLLGYALTRGFALLLPIPLAIKAVIALAIIGLPLAAWRLCHVSGADRVWSLAAFPLGLGFCFHWGFLNYIVALPLGVWLLAEVLRYAQQRTLRRALVVVALTLVLFFAHALVLAVCGLTAVVLLLAQPGTIRSRLLVVWPLAAPLPLLATWAALAHGGEAAQTQLGYEWGAVWRRPLEWPGLLLGSADDLLARFGLLVAVIVLLWLGVRLSGRQRIWTGLLVLALVYLTFPVFGFGVALLYPRFAVLVALVTLPTLSLPTSAWRRRAVQTLIVLLPALWLAVAGVRFHAFDRDARSFDRLLDIMEPGKRVRMLMLDLRAPGALDFPVMMHFPTWYQVSKGGQMNFSFALFFPELVRYHGMPSFSTPRGAETAIERFVYARERVHFDYFVVRAHRDRTAQLFPGAGDRLRLLAHEGAWWLYQNQRQEPR